jgi:hypothetical protein
MNFTPYAVLWAVLALTTAGLALYRKFIAMNEDDYIHLAAGGERFAAKQIEMAGKLDAVDFWGKAVTGITVITGLMIGAAYLYLAWVAGAAK